jgi:uncharacterized protein
MSESKVFLFDNSDPEMQAAYEKARSTFRYFWREVAWERRRIIPALDLASVKAPFSDGAARAPTPDEPEVEHMWLGEVDFDGEYVSGVLLNSPNWLTTVQEGDSARIALGQISDWMYSIAGEVYGAYTVNLLRSRMDPRERQQHDEAWGLEFGDPKKIRVAQGQKSGGFFKSLFGGRSEEEIGEHPMSENMGPALAEQLRKDPSFLTSTDDEGWTLLHHQALAGSAASVKILLDQGANPNAVTTSGKTPLQLARSLHWDKVIALLMAKGGR